MALEFEDVSLQVNGEQWIYPTQLALEPGGFNILLGTTLAGKTSLMRLMAGLEPPSSGRILFNGKDVTGQSVRKRNVAMVYQQFINYPNFTVYDNIASPLRIQGKKRKAISERIQAVAELLKLEPMLKRMPSELSGGQQQRCALARALVKDAELVLLDEPLANLDYKLREELREELPRLFKASGSTVVYATSEPIEALLLGGHTATMHEGRVTQFGPTRMVYGDPLDLQSAAVFSDPPINIAAVSKQGGRVQLGEFASFKTPPTLAAHPDGDYQMALRPHQLTLASGERDTVPLEAEVVLSEISGSESTLHVKLGASEWVSLNHGIHEHRRGERVQLHLDPAQCLFFNTDARRVA